MSHIKVQMSETELRQEYAKYIENKAKLTSVANMLADVEFRKILKDKVAKTVDKQEDVIHYEVK